MKNLLILSLFIFSCGNPSDAFRRESKIYALHNGKLEDGIYLVGTVNKHGYLTQINPDFIYPTDSMTQMVLDTDNFVPLRLSAPPDSAHHEERNNTKLMLSLNKESSDDLELLTGNNIGHRVAIVIGGEITTMHGIKAKITGGKLQITRCTDNACEKLYFELKDNLEK